MAGALSWPLESIRDSVAPLLPGFSVELLPVVDSTNSELMRRARSGRTEPVLLVAQHQTAGRGRLGRHWLGTGVQPGAKLPALTFSLGMLMSAADWSGLSLAVGWSVAQSLHPDIRLKWPNDLWWRDRKLAGILIETVNWGSRTASLYVVVGVGINLQPPNAAGLSMAPAGLNELRPDLDAAAALERVAAPLVQTIRTFEARGFAPFQTGFNAVDALARVPVVLSDGMQGVAQGVDAGGALLVQTAQGLVRVTSSEVSVRPQPGPGYGHL